MLILGHIYKLLTVLCGFVNYQDSYCHFFFDEYIIIYPFSCCYTFKVFFSPQFYAMSSLSFLDVF